MSISSSFGNRLALVVAVVVGIASFGVHLAGGEAARGRSFSAFEKRVAPVLGETCSAQDASGAYVCHGRPSGQFANDDGLAEKLEGTGDNVSHIVSTIMASSCSESCHRKSGDMAFSFPLGPNGSLETDRQLVLAYQKAQRYTGSPSAARFSKLLRMPLGAQGGGFGLYHQGGEIFENAADSEYLALADWVNLENKGREVSAVEVGEAQRIFHEEVLPVMARNTCLSPSCHIFNHSSFIPDPGMPSLDLAKPLNERFTSDQASFNRMTSKGLIQSLVYLTGDIEQSRILKKVIPIDEGGMLHRGGNRQFLSGPDDPDYAAFVRWLGAERSDALSKLRIGGAPVDPDRFGKVQGVVFVRTPTKNHRRYLDVGKYLPGGDLYLVKLQEGESLETASSAPINLTARFHLDREADIREPDVRYDGRAIVFAMRIGEEDNLNLYEVGLDESLDYREGSFRRLTYGPAFVDGIRVHYTDPTYVPDPLDVNAAGGGYNLDRVDLVFASNLSGEMARSVERGIVGEADGGTRSTLVDLDRPEPSGSFVGKRLYVVDGTNEGEWRRITAFENRLFGEEGRSIIRVDSAFPQPVDDSTIYVIEREAETQPGFLPSYSVYGMKLGAPGDESETYEATLTRVTYGIGQELDLSVRTTGEVFYTSQRSSVDKAGRPIFHLASCRRHLDTRFSFPTHHGNRSQVLIYADNHELPSGIDIHVGMDPDDLWEGGNLSVSDHQFGPGLEARNPHDYSTGFFDEDGVPQTLDSDITNTRFEFKNGSASHPRFVFKKNALFPLRGPDAVTRTGYSPGGIFRDPIPLPDGRLLVSHSPDPIDHQDPGANPDFDLYVLEGDSSFHPDAGKGVPQLRKTKLEVASAEGLSDVQAYPIYARMKPKVNAGRRPKNEHLIRYPGDEPDQRPARYLERNYLLIDAIMQDPSPVGKHVAYAQNPVTGEDTPEIDRIAYVRMVEAIPMTLELAAPIDTSRVRNGDPESTRVANGIHTMKRIVGEAPVEKDGSIYFQVPSNTPLIIQSLNADGMALRQEARPYFFAPNEPFTVSPSASETFQTCGACMGSMTGKPEDLFGPVNPFSGQGEVDAIAKYGNAPPAMAIAVEDRLSIDFERNIQPVLDDHCVACHSGEKPAAELSLSGERTVYYNDAYESLLQLEESGSGWYGKKKFVSERNGLAIESYLTEKLYGKELKAPRELAGDQPHPSPALFREWKLEPAPLSEAERFLFVRWIDMGATFRGPDPSDPSDPSDPRRYARAERP